MECFFFSYNNNDNNEKKTFYWGKINIFKVIYIFVQSIIGTVCNGRYQMLISSLYLIDCKDQFWNKGFPIFS